MRLAGGLASASRALLVAAACAIPFVAATGCFAADEGKAPDINRLYFPVGVAISPEHHWMFVANSDFDLQFNAGSLQVFDLTAIRKALPTYCHADSDCTAPQVCDLPGSPTNQGFSSNWCVDPADPNPCAAEGVGLQSDADRRISPGRCAFVSPANFVEKKVGVGIGAFATDVVYAPSPVTDGGRLFLPVRGDATLHWIDVDFEGGDENRITLDCGQDENGVCDRNHRRGEEPDEENTRNLELPVEPFGIAVDSRGESIVVTHQTTGQVSLFVNHWTPEGGVPVGPELQFVLGQQGSNVQLPSGAMSIAAVPEPAVVARDPTFIEQNKYQPGFLMTFRNSAEVRLVRFFSDAAAGRITPSRPFIDTPGTSIIGTNSQGFDSRGIAIDGSSRQACEAACSPNDTRCLGACVNVPLDVYVANRTPPSLVLGKTQGGGPPTTPTATPQFDDLPRFYDTIPLTAGASRVVIGDVIDTGGNKVIRVFVMCFDSRRIYIYDPAARRIEATIDTGRGPYAMAIDTVVNDSTEPGQGTHALGYVGHFTDSYLGVVDLDQRHTETYGTLVMTLGQPIAPRASK